MIFDVEIVEYAPESRFAEFERALLSAEKLVKDVVVTEKEGEVTVAYLTHPVFFKSEGDALDGRVANLAKGFFSDYTVTVTKNTAVFYKIKLGIR